MRLCEVCDMDIITNGGAVRRIKISAKNGKIVNMALQRHKCACN